jgi:hypothetical protein
MGVSLIMADPVPQANAKRRRLVTILFRSRVDQPLPDHEADQSGDVADTELAHQVGPVVLGSLDADMEATGDFLTAVALGDEDGDLAFARGELVDHAVAEEGRGGEGLPDGAAEVLVEPGVAERQRLEGLAEFGERAVLIHEAMDAGLHEGADDVRLLLAGEDQHLHRGQAAAEPAQDLDAADAGHDHVEHQDVGLQAQGQFDGAEPVGGRADRDAARMGLDHLRDQVAHRRLVLHDQHPFLGIRRRRGVRLDRLVAGNPGRRPGDVNFAFRH